MLVVNLYGGPGSGKSTTAAGVFSKLKLLGINCEYVSEFVKDLTWEERACELSNQIYIFGNQLQRIQRMKGKVDIVVTDSPILLSTAYGKSSDTFKKLVFEEHQKLNSLNIFVQRVKKFNPSGRVQNFEESVEKDVLIEKILNERSIDFSYINGDQTGIDLTVNFILKKLKKVDL